MTSAPFGPIRWANVGLGGALILATLSAFVPTASANALPEIGHLHGECCPLDADAMTTIAQGYGVNTLKGLRFIVTASWECEMDGAADDCQVFLDAVPAKGKADSDSSGTGGTAADTLTASPEVRCDSIGEIVKIEVTIRVVSRDWWGAQSKPDKDTATINVLCLTKGDATEPDLPALPPLPTVPGVNPPPIPGGPPLPNPTLPGLPGGPGPKVLKADPEPVEPGLGGDPGVQE